MHGLPFVDEHTVRVLASPDATWQALRRFARRLERPAPRAFARAWRLEPASGFAVEREATPNELTFAGHHRFARYELSFTVDGEGAARTLHARTHAEFHGVAGRIYRALVIGSGGHRLAVRWMLTRIRRTAERAH